MYPRTFQRIIIYALLSIISIIFVLSYARAYIGLWIVFICFIWVVIDPYLFVVIVLPALMVFSDTPALVFLGQSWSILRLVFLLIVIGVVLKPARLLRYFKKMPSYLLASMILLLIFYILSAIYNGWPSYSSDHLISFILRLGLIILVFVSVYSLENPKPLFIGLLIQGIVMTISGLIIWREFGTYMAIRSIGIGYTRGSPLLYFASYGVAYASLNVTSGLGSISLGIMSERQITKRLFTLLGILLILASIMSSRRAAVIAIGLALLFILFFERNKNAVSLVVLFALVITPLLFTGYFDQFFSVRESLFSEFTGGGTGRLELMTTGLSEWQKSPIWGFGPGSQPEVYKVDYGFSHNSFVSALLEGGVFAVFPVLAIIIGITLQTFKAGKKLRFYPKESIWPILFLASLSNILVMALISGDLVGTNNAMILVATVSAYCGKIQHDKIFQARKS